MTPPSVMKKRAFIAAGVLALSGLAVFMFTRKHESVAAEGVRDVPSFDGQTIRYSDGFAMRTGLVFAVAESGSLSPTVNLTGTVSFDPERVAVVGARIAGRLRKISKFEGDEVKVTDVLAELESADLGQAQSTLLSTQAHFAAAQANEARETQLSEARVSAKRDAELAHATAQAARADLTAAQQRVQALGGSGSGEVGVMRILSPIAGKIVNAPVSRGQSVEPSTLLFRVADLSRVWVELAVFEREIAHIKQGDSVEISPQINAPTVRIGKVAHVGDVIDRETRSGDVRVVVDNVDGLLRPGQSVLAKIHTQTQVSSGFILPREAVTMVDGKSTVFVLHEKNAVEPRAITTGAQDSARVEVTAGLTAGESVAVKGVFALKSEIFR
jgi:membrane fusion protein, heavy metal efflux system